MPNGQTTNTYVSFDILIVQLSFNKQFRCQSFSIERFKQFQPLQSSPRRKNDMFPKKSRVASSTLFVFLIFCCCSKHHQIIHMFASCPPGWVLVAIQSSGRQGMIPQWHQRNMIVFFLIRLLGGTCFLFFECIYSYVSVLLVFTGIL